MKVYINKANENWICDRIRDDFVYWLSDLITTDPREADIIWLVAPWALNVPFQILKEKIVIATVHHIDPDKFNKDDFLARDKFIDHYHVPNNYTRDFISDYIPNSKITVISYWYNHDLWFSIDDKKSLREKYGIPEGSFTIGSFQRDTEGGDLKSPKLCKGPDVLCDIIEELTPKPHVVLAGWRRQYVISRLKKAEIPFSYFEYVDLETLNELYNLLDLYLVTSRHEGGPQSILECASTLTPILSTDVGIAASILQPNTLCSTSDDFVRGISTLKFYNTAYNYKRAQGYELRLLLTQYLSFFTSIYKKHEMPNP